MMFRRSEAPLQQGPSRRVPGRRPSRSGLPITLIDGEKLIGLLIEYDVGVGRRPSTSLNSILAPPWPPKWTRGA